MNCMQHPDAAAVTSCVQCGLGMCPECVNHGIRQDSKSLCPRCAPGHIKAAIAQLQKQRWWNKFKLCLALPIMALGVFVAIAMYYNPKNPGDTFSAVFYLVFAFGLVGGTVMLLNGAFSGAGRVADNTALLFAVGATEGAMSYGCGSLLGALISGFVCGSILAPLEVYWGFSSIRTSNKWIAYYEKLLEKYA